MDFLGRHEKNLSNSHMILSGKGYGKNFLDMWTSETLPRFHDYMILSPASGGNTSAFLQPISNSCRNPSKAPKEMDGLLCKNPPLLHALYCSAQILPWITVVE